MKTKVIHSLAFRTALKLVIVISIIMAIICGFISITQTNTVTKMAEEKTTILADKNAKTLADYMDSLFQRVNLLANAFSELRNTYAESSKQMINDVIIASLKSDKSIIDVTLATDPNKFFNSTPDGYVSMYF